MAFSPRKPEAEPIVIVAGQSNGRKLALWEWARMINLAVDGSTITQWAPSGAYATSVVDYVSAQPIDEDISKKVMVLWCHGESAALNSTESSNYANSLDALFDWWISQMTGRTLAVIAPYLHVDTNRAYTGIVRTQQASISASRSDVYDVSFDAYPLEDGVHYAQASRANRRNALSSIVASLR